MPKKTPEEKYVALYRTGDCQPIGILRKSAADILLRDLPSEGYWTLPNLTKANAQEIINGTTKCTRRSKEPDGIENYISI